MTAKRAGILLALMLPAALLWWAGARIRHAEANVRVELSCDGEQCEARIDGGEPLVQEIHGARRARRLGLYAYHSWEATRTTRFRDLQVQRIAGLRPYDLSLTELDHAGWFENDADDAWTVIEGRGLTRRGPPGSRGVALLAPPTESDFRLSVTLDDPIDAGIAFRGYDAENTWMFVVRAAYNDAYFYRVHRGKPQEIRAIMPLRELTVGREALRLAGLIGEIVALGAALLLALGLAAALVGRLPLKLEPFRFEPHRGLVRTVALTLFVATVLMCASISTAWLQRVPHIDDEAVYLFQARVFAGGELWARAPVDPEFFAHEHMIVQGERWFSKYPPLFSAVLALGVLAGLPWLVNPLLAAVTGWLVYRLGRELAGPVWGLLAWGLLLASPFFTVMGATFMSHMLAALLAAGFLLCCVRAARNDSSALWAAAGGLLGAGLLARPFTAALVGAAVVPFLARRWIERPRWLGLLALGVLPGAAALFVWAALHSPPGDLTLNPYAMNEASDTLGFGPDKGSTWLRTWGSFGHTPGKALHAAHNFLDYTSKHQFGWPLRLSFAFALAGCWWHRKRREAWMLAAVPVALALGHGFYWATQHLLYGARYWFAGVPAVVLLTVLGLRTLAISAAPRDRAALHPILAAAVVAMVGYNLWAYLPKRLHELPQFGGVHAGLEGAVQRAGIERGIVFVHTLDRRFNDGFWLNDPTDPNATLFAVDRGDANRELMRRHPDREAWEWDGERLVPLVPRAGVRE